MPEDEHDAQVIADVVELETRCFMMRQDLKKSGIGISNRQHLYKPPRKEFEWGARKQHITVAKSNGKCREWGAMGHW